MSCASSQARTRVQSCSIASYSKARGRKIVSPKRRRCLSAQSSAAAETWTAKVGLAIITATIAVLGWGGQASLKAASPKGHSALWQRWHPHAKALDLTWHTRRQPRSARRCRRRLPRLSSSAGGRAHRRTMRTARTARCTRCTSRGRSASSRGVGATGTDERGDHTDDWYRITVSCGDAEAQPPHERLDHDCQRSPETA